MLLLALQTTTSAASDGHIDTLTLVLVVMFIAAMLALSLLMRRPESEDPDEAASDGRQPEELVQSSIRELPPARRDRSSSSSRGSVPVWLQGVFLPGTDASLSASTSVIEALLTARRDHDLAAGLALFTPGTRASLAKQLGIDAVESTEILANAAFEGDPPALRSAEIVEGVGARMTVRATYSSGSSENYTLTWLDGAWLIEEITASR